MNTEQREQESLIRKVLTVHDGSEFTADMFPRLADGIAASKALDALLARLRTVEQERDDQMQSKLDAQMTLKLVVEAVDLRLADLGNGWKEATPKILARLTEIVDEHAAAEARVEAAERQRDEARSEVLDLIGGWTEAVNTALDRAKAAEEALQAYESAIDRHELWCGYRADAPGDGSLNHAQHLARAVLAPSQQEEK